MISVGNSKELKTANSVQQSRSLLYMYGAVTQIELNSFLAGNSCDSEARKREIKQQWLQAAECFQQIVSQEAGEPDSAERRPVEGADEFLKSFREGQAFKETFANFPVTIEEVEISKIVASQRTVHLDYVERLKTEIRPDPEFLASFCLSNERINSPLKYGRTAPNAFTFSSEDPGLRFLGAFEQPFRPDLKQNYHPGGQPVHAVTLLVGYGSSAVNVYRVGKRVILNNGFHRFYALLLAGIAFAPAVVQQVTHPELELPPVVAQLPREYVVEAPRPGLMKDFLNNDLVCEITQRNFMKALQIAWGETGNFIPM